jgi:hypothetical protein
MNYAEMNQLLIEKRPMVKGIKDLNSGKFYDTGENPFMDMQIDNCLLWRKEYGNNWFGFIRSNYELIMK